jgi:UrcA family protein
MNMNSKVAAHFVGIALIVAALTGPKVFAAPPDPSTTRTTNLTLTDLDLSRAADVKIAGERILLAASKLCEGVRDPLSLSQHEAYLDCVARATTAAEPKLERLAAAQTAATQLMAAQR